MRLEPLTLDHERELLEICGDPEIWRFTTSEAQTPATMRAYLDVALHDYSAGTALPFVVRLLRTESVVGMTRLKNLSSTNLNAEVGSWFAREAWGTGVNRESKLLLLGYAFEQLRLIRVEFQTDALNARSRAALKRLGAVEEGVLRSRRIHRNGERRDSVFFSILDTEWPAVKGGAGGFAGP
ncbi:MAG TPA: GNAT family N-acetyltransferase [Bryobacteraceae bacterium]|nr:GNAT family N-acetyltransferase [Bryobacteraceae bacterium]